MQPVPLTIGIDLGGTKIDIGLVDASGKIVQQRLLKTRTADGPEAIVEDISAAASELCRLEKGSVIIGAGAGMAAQIEKGTGLVNFAPNLGWIHFPLQEALSKALKLPVFVTNDVRAAAWGEWLYGAGKGFQDIVSIFVGTGIGGCLISGGTVLEGFNNTAGEIGHMTVDLDGPLCACGNHGCLEAFAGGRSIGQRGREWLNNPQITAKEVFELSSQNVPLARKIIDEAKSALIAGVANLVNILSPSHLIMGGSLIVYHPELLDLLREEVPKRALKAAMRDVKIMEAQLKNHAGMIGAAALASLRLTRRNQ